MEATNSNHLWMLSSCALFAELASAQSLEDELGELASEAVSVFTSVTSEVVSMWTELTSIVANAPASTNPAASSATATSASSLASESSSIASASSSIASQSAVISSASSSFSSALSSLSSSSQSASARASASSALSSSVSSAFSSLSSSSGSTSSPTSSHSSARSTGSSSSRGSSSSSATSQVAASSPNGDSNLSSSHHSHPNVVGIVVGTVVGALVLGLLILLALLCLRRRRRRRRRRRTGVSPTDAEVESWRNTHEDEYAFLGPGTQRATAGHDNVMAAAAVPAMREGSMHNRHHNPFVPAPPPPRRVAANSRPGLADGAVPGQMPFDAAAVGSSGVHPAYRGDPAAAARDQHHHGLGKDIAVGAGGALLGAAAMKHHNDKDRRKESIEMPADTPRRHSIQRKPVGAAVPNMNEDTSAESTLLNPRQSLDQQDSGYKSDIVSPTSPTGPAELPSPSYDRGAGGDNEPLLGGRGEKAAGLFALAASANRRNHDRNNSNNSASRPVLQRASSSDYEDVPIAMAAGPSSNRPSYQSYQPQDSPTLATSASSSYPTTRSSSAPDVPARSPARASVGPDTPPSDASSDSLSKSAAPSSRRRSASVEAAEAAVEREEAADHVSDTLIPAMWRRSAEGGARMPPKGVSYHDFKPVRRDVSTGYNNSGGSSSNYNAAPSSSSSSSSSSATGQRRLSDRSGAYAQLTGQQANAFAGSPRDTRRVSLSELIEEEKRLEAARQRRRSSGSRGSSSALASPWHSGAATPTEAYEGRGYGVGQAL